MSVIDRIIQTLKNKGLMQKDLVGYLRENTNLRATETTISDWKSGKSNSYYTVIPNISNFLQVSCDYILTGKESIQNHHTGKEAEIIELYNQLDREDQAEVRGYIKGLLRTEKYNKNFYEETGKLA
ncbi:MAG: hypothetical protein IJ300_05790 [Clostridia bacterium]|nr:hypothetical protein [Clostridia bacterium]